MTSRFEEFRLVGGTCVGGYIGIVCVRACVALSVYKELSARCASPRVSRRRFSLLESSRGDHLLSPPLSSSLLPLPLHRILSDRELPSHSPAPPLPPPVRHYFLPSLLSWFRIGGHLFSLPLPPRPSLSFDRSVARSSLPFFLYFRTKIRSRRSKLSRPRIDSGYNTPRIYPAIGINDDIATSSSSLRLSRLSQCVVRRASCRPLLRLGRTLYPLSRLLRFPFPVPSNVAEP